MNILDSYLNLSTSGLSYTIPDYYRSNIKFLYLKVHFVHKLISLQY